MLKKIQKVEKALIDAGIDYDFAIDFNSKTLIETSILKWRDNNGNRMVFTEDNLGETGLMCTNPSSIIIDGKAVF